MMSFTHLTPSSSRVGILGALFSLGLAACGSPYLVEGGQPGAVAAGKDSVFWLSSGGVGVENGGVALEGAQVMRVPTAGASSTSVASLPGNLGGVAVGTDAVFFTSIHIERSDEKMRSTLHRLSLAGGAATEVVTFVSQEANVGGVAVDATHVYWVTNLGNDGSTLHEAPIGGGTPVTLFTAPAGAQIRGLVADGTAVYWTVTTESVSDGAVMKLALAGGAPVSLATGQANPVGLAVDAGFVYWTNFVVGEGTVMKVPLGGGAPVTLVAHEQGPAGVAVDGEFAYWTSSDLDSPNTKATGAVKRVPLGGGEAVTLAEGFEDPEALALTADEVYWTDGKGLEKVAKGSAGAK